MLVSDLLFLCLSYHLAPLKCLIHFVRDRILLEGSKNASIVPILQPKQQKVMDELLANPNITEICMYGAGRSGKTFLCCDYLHERAIAYPGSSHLFIRATMNSLSAGVLSQTFPRLWGAIKKETGANVLQDKTNTGLPFVYHRATPINRFIYYNGSEIRFAGLDLESTNAASLDKILSQEYLTIVFEEATEIDFKTVDLAKSRLAQKVFHAWAKNEDGTPVEGIPKWICTLNPRSFEDWDYVYFQEHKHPTDDTDLKHPERTAWVHFSLDDNISNVSEHYLSTLESTSSSNQQRFLVGMHSDQYEGEIFKHLNWENAPPITEMEKVITYTDPSFKSGPKNDYKASVLLGMKSGAYWVIDGRAMQCTSSQMVINVHELNYEAAQAGWTKPINNWFENAGMPDDFESAITAHSLNTGWVMPYQWDNREKGDKFSRIEAGLEPLNRDGKLFFNEAIKKTHFGRLCSVQFLNFKHKMLATEHDDIPDAVHGGVTLMNMPTLRPGQTRVTDQRSTKRLG